MQCLFLNSFRTVIIIMELLDSFLIARIASHLPSPLDISFRAACRKFARAIEPPRKLSPNELMEQGARLLRADLCKLAYSRGATNYDVLLDAAARAGNHALCILAREWDHRAYASVINYDYVIVEAAYRGDSILCNLAHKWGGDSNWMLQGAARGGHRDLCILARKWIDDSDYHVNYDKMIMEAAYGNQPALCTLAREWGASVDSMLRGATYGGHRELCILAREWGAHNFSEMLNIATENHYNSLCDLAREWIGM